MPRPEVIAHLHRLYEGSDDPWDHRASPFEAEKYRRTLEAIGPGPFAHALEIGCGIGELSRRLAPRCRRLTMMDCIPKALRAARAAVAGMDHVEVLLGAAPQDLPAIRPDLILLSEVLYFLTPDEIGQLAAWIARAGTGTVVAINWTGPTDEELTGPAAVTELARHLPLTATRAFPDFRIDRFAPRQASG